MQLKKSTKLGKNKIYNFFYLIFLFSLFSFKSFANNINFVEIKILDKVSSKNSELILKIGEETKFENLLIKSLKCKNSEFDDDPEITAYLQVIDITSTDNDRVFVFNGWAFASSPSLKPFDHPIYDIWLISCY